MFVRSLTLEHFRSYDQYTFAFEKRGLEILVGENGSGKTNVIEALSILSSGQSCLRGSPDDAVRWGGFFYRLRAEVKKDSGETLTVESVYQQQPTRQRAYFLSDIRTSQLKMRGTIPAIVFLPEDLILLTGSPQLRRDFFDAFLGQLSAEFVLAKAEYQRVLKQRNTLLKRINAGQARSDELNIWDDQLSKHGAVMHLKRIKLAQSMNDGLTIQLQRLGERWQAVEIKYKRKTTGETTADIESQLKMLLIEYRRKDLLNESTTVGPHRDDWLCMADDHDVSTFASRGQHRACLLAFLLQAKKAVESYRHERPVILLDDVFSEFDERHQLHLLEEVKEHQVLLTSTHTPHRTADEFSLWRLSSGHLPILERVNTPNSASASASAASSG